MTKEYGGNQIMTNFTPTYLHHRQREEEKIRQQQRIDFALRNKPNNSTSVASDTITFTKKHKQSMSNALAEVRKNETTIPDGLHIRPENHKGFY